MKVLIVEDELLVAKDLSEILTNRGYEVTDNVASVDEAIRSLTQNPPNIVLLDITLKGQRDGIDLAYQLQSEFRLPYIYITSHSDMLTFERAKQTRPFAYLVKPFKEVDVYNSTELAITHYVNTTLPKELFSKKESELPRFRIRNVRTYILDHLDQSIKLAHLAEVAQMDVFHFSHVFKQNTGIAPYQYVINLRIERAVQLLSETKLPIAQIAYEVGFCSQSQLNKHFKKIMNIPPGEFRKATS